MRHLSSRGGTRDLDTDANFVSLNTADNWLHLVLGAGMVLLGLAVPGHRVDLRDRSFR